MRNLVLKKRDEVNQPTLLQVAGSRLGCLDCNRWSWEGSKHLFTELPEEDLQALRERMIAR
jgi:hypothetical protein